jgi:hypothetical protein
LRNSFVAAHSGFPSRSVVLSFLLVGRGDFLAVQSDFFMVQSDFSTVQSDFLAVQSDFFAVQSDFSVVQSDFFAVQSDFSAVQSDFFAVQSDFSAVQSDFFTQVCRPLKIFASVVFRRYKYFVSNADNAILPVVDIVEEICF